jgi:cytochrome P450
MSAVEREDFDRELLTPEFMADPYAYYHRLRAADPVYWSERLGAWMLTRYHDVTAALRDPRLNQGDRIAAILSQLPAERRADFQALSLHLTRWIVFTDPPDHTRLRALANKAFTPRVVGALRPRIQALVDTLLDARQAAGQIDFVKDFAFPLPAIVIAEMLGIPPSDHERFKRWTADIAGFLSAGQITLAVAEAAQKSVLELRAYLGGIAEACRQRPQADLISALVAADEHGERLSDDEFTATCVQLLFAGHETTEGLIGNGLLALMQHPDQMQWLQAHPAAMPTAVEEFLRYDSSVQRQARVASLDFDLGGRRIRRGQYILIFLGAANRDPDQFPDPDRLDVARTENKHVSFGSGIHFCLGAPLARLEGEIAIGTALRRMPAMRLATDTLEREPLLALRKLKSLPVVF